MASSVDIVPSLGQGLSFLQEGPGASPGYGAIDRRRMLVASGVREGIVHEAAYAVTADGTGLNVTIDADAGLVNIQGDSVAQQGIYTVAPHNSNITLDIGTAHATLPRNDLVVLEALDDDHDSGGLNKGRVRVVPGTPTAAAVKTDAFGVHGTPSPGNSQFPLAVVNVPATDTSITADQVDDRRYRTSGYCAVAGREAGNWTSYAYLPTPDRVRNLVLPAGGLIHIRYQATWQEDTHDAARAAIFLGANQIKAAFPDSAIAMAAATGEPTTVSTDRPLVTSTAGLGSWTTGSGYTGDVTTGQVLGLIGASGVNNVLNADAGLGTAQFGVPGVCTLFANPGVYDVGVKFKVSAGSFSAIGRKLWVWTEPFPS